MMYNVMSDMSSEVLHYRIDKGLITGTYYLGVRKPNGAWELVQESNDCDALVDLAKGLVEEAEQCS